MTKIPNHKEAYKKVQIALNNMDIKDVTKIKEKIKGYVNTVDSWYLIEMGAPDDEYDFYINHIVSLIINKKPDQAELELELYRIFKTKEFELEKDKIKELATKLAAFNV